MCTYIVDIIRDYIIIIMWGTLGGRPRMYNDKNIIITFRIF